MAPSLHSLALAILLIVLSTAQPPSLAAASESHNLLMLDRFHRWMSVHGRSYRSAGEKQYRLEVYSRNVEYIEASNRDPERLGYELGENIFTDLTNEEFVSMYANGGASLPEDDKVVSNGDDDMIITTLAGNVSEGHGSNGVTFDWRAKGAVTPAKLQGKTCGSCFAFAAAALVESLVQIKSGSLLDLSEQEIVDCDPAQAADPCKSGGQSLYAVQYVKSKGGLVSEAAYPYVEKKQTCKDMKGLSRVGKIVSITRVAVLNEPLLASYMFRSPVIVYMDASGDLQYYKSGIYKGPCTAPTNHAVVLVGWGVDDVSKVSYWIAKNSWGATWGQNGFFFMRKGADGPTGLCGISKAGAISISM